MTTPDTEFPIVALGGSAGALQAFFAFFGGIAPAARPRMAFVVVLHLAADEESHLVELLAGKTELPVEAIVDRVKVQPGHVYVLPPDRTLDVEDGALVPKPRAPGRAHRPVDDIFLALAREFGERTAAVVFSGTGSNGSRALGAVREAGGCVIAQAPDDAEFDEMPRRAIDTGHVDMVLEPEEMVPALQRNSRRLRAADTLAAGDGSDRAPGAGSEAGLADAAATEDAFDRILRVLRSRCGIDFRHYKSGTLFRRIDRRVHFLGLDDWEAYADLLERSPDEAQTLLKDVLITVTSFFRDAEAWDRLTTSVLKPLVEASSEDRPIRIWVAGCATGEEAYSVAIATFDLLHDREADAHVEIFATDASHEALARARQGRYPAAAVEHLPESLVDRWFERLDDHVQIKPQVRDAMIFAPQNLIHDPPFSHADVVICRNLLIYLKPEMQRRLIRLFHFALKEGGALFLGSAEGIGDARELFEPVDKKARIWRRIGPTRHDIVEFPLLARQGPRVQHAPPPGPSSRPRSPRLSDRVATALAERYAPPAVVVEDGTDVAYYHGDVGRFLRPQTGEATQNLMSLARDGLAPYLRRAIEAATRSGRRESIRTRLLLDDNEQTLLIEAAPFPGSEGRLLVSFVEERPATAPESGAAQPATSREKDLEQEVRLLRQELAATTLSSNRNLEETRAYNEEITSMNEELRAANEELETSKEELQSLNEELKTVNNQLRATVNELRERTADLDNLLHSTGVATLFLDTDLSVRWFSPRVADLFRLREADFGRPISDIVQDFEDGELEEDCRRVLRTLERREAVVETFDGRSFVRQISPYRDAADRIAGVVLSFGDITEIQTSRRYAERIVETVPTPFLVLDTELRVVSANPVFYETFGVEPVETENRLIYDLGNGQWNIPELRHLLNDILPDNEVFEGFEVTHEFSNIGRKTMVLNGRRLDHVQLILLAIEDITERKEAERRQAILMGELGHRVKNALGVVQGIASQTLRSSRTLEEFGEAFSGRLSAYSRAHNQLLTRDWRPGSLRDVIEVSVSGQGARQDRVEIDGPPVQLSAEQSLALSLVLHELETNATKYGALSSPDGRVSITWSIDEGNVQLLWRETGGPRVVVPETEGFGSILIRQSVDYQLGGKADLSFEPAGVVCRISFPTADG